MGVNRRGFIKLMSETGLGLLLFITLIPVLISIPYWIPPNPNIVSASAAVGYNNSLAQLIVAFWSLAVVLTYFLLARGKRLPSVPTDSLGGDPPNRSGNLIGRTFIVELLLVGLGCVVVYFPIFLARHGPYLEDNYFLTLAQRMLAGQTPYLDFEFPYGPLMAFIPAWWMSVWGFSMKSYYFLITLLEIIQFSILLFVLHLYFPKLRLRIGAFVLFAILLGNTLLGLNWNGLRRLLPVLALLLISQRPMSKSVILGSGLLIGLGLTYSQDYGMIALLAGLSIYGLIAFTEKRLKPILSGIFLLITSVGIWVLFTSLLLGKNQIVYIKAAIYTLGRFSKGEAGFPFYWTVNSLLIFGLLCLVSAIVGIGLWRGKGIKLHPGDLFFFAGWVYALAGLKSGFNRVDMWHLSAPMLPIIFAIVLPLPRTVFILSQNAKKIAILLVIGITVTYLAALLPEASYLARGWYNGMVDTLHPSLASDTPELHARFLSIEPERSLPQQDIVALGNYLASDVERDRPVVLYGRLWAIDKRIGVPKSTYPTDDFLLSDQAGEDIQQYLSINPDALVVITRTDFQFLQGLLSKAEIQEDFQVYPETHTKRILSWLSTVHYKVIGIEALEKAERWKRTVGNFLVQKYVQVAQFGDMIVLATK